MKIAFVSSECTPFAKTGGLADVTGTLPRWIHARGHDIRVFMPKYGRITPERFSIKKLSYHFSVPVNGRPLTAHVWKGSLPGKVPVYFIEHDPFFKRKYLYGTSEEDYTDNDERFIFFNRAVIELLRRMRFKPDIVHGNDWQTGLMPVYLKHIPEYRSWARHTASVFTIHNIAYQGRFDKKTLLKAGLDWPLFTMDGLEYFDQVCLLKAGIVYSDFITTVSPTYAREIMSGKEFGFGMEGILKHRSKQVRGILNGIDYDEWDPRSDPHIAKTYVPPKDFAGKRDAKKELQKIFNFEIAPHIPLAGIVSRLTAQKGFDLLTSILGTILKNHNLQLVILGTGEVGYQHLLQRYHKAYPRVLGIACAFDNDLAHKIYAGCDFFLMPSHYEPCGLGQMISMRYGTVPIVMKTGGLADTVIDYGRDHDRGNGIVFSQYQPTALEDAIKRAVKYWLSSKDIAQLRKNMAAVDFTWKTSAQHYIDLYETLLKKKR